MIGGWTTPLPFQWVVHISQSPHRIYRQFWFCGPEEYTENGMSTWVDAPHKLSLWLFDQNAAFVTVALVSLLSLGVFSMVVEGLAWFIL